MVKILKAILIKKVPEHYKVRKYTFDSIIILKPNIKKVLATQNVAFIPLFPVQLHKSGVCYQIVVYLLYGTFPKNKSFC